MSLGNERAPSPFLVVTPPDYTIIAVNDEYLRATMIERAAILGRRLFEVFMRYSSMSELSSADDRR